MIQSESYFMVGKEDHNKRKPCEKISTGKISSKQLGEELSNGRKAEVKKSQKNGDDDSSNQTCRSSDASRMWPLTCFELSVSVEQEDRLLQAHKR